MSRTLEHARISVVLDFLQRILRSNLTPQEFDLISRAALLLTEAEGLLAASCDRRTGSVTDT